MIALILYIATALLTGFQVFTLFMWGIWGAPTSPWQCLSVLGSLILFTAALLTGVTSRLAARVALVGTAMMWLYYGPAVPTTIATYQQLGTHIDAIGSLMIFGPVCLLLATTVYALLAGVLVPTYITAPAWLVPEVVKPRTFVIFVSSIVIVILAWLLYPFLKVSYRTVTHDMHWRCDNESEARCAEVILTYAGYPYRYERIESPQLSMFLQQQGLATVTAQFEVIQEWGKVKNYRLARVAQLSMGPEEWSGGGYGCSNKPESDLARCGPGEQEWGQQWWGSGDISGACGGKAEPGCGREDPRLASPWEE